MKNLKKMIIFLIIIIIILLSVFAVLFLKKDNDEKIEDNEDHNVQEYSEQDTGNINDLLTVEKALQNYYDIITITEDNISENKTNEYGEVPNGQYGENDEIDSEDEIELSKIKDNSETQIQESKIALLNKEYIEEKNINVNNVEEYIKTPDEKAIAIVVDIKKEVEESIERYAVKGFIMNLDYKIIDNFIMEIDLDMETGAFSVKPIEEDIEDLSKITFSKNSDNIKINDYNEFEYLSLDDEGLAKEYMGRYKKIALASPDTIYNFLDEKYREKRFGNLENYKKYVEENYDKIEAISISKYRVDEYDDYRQYVCVDQNGLYYIFKEPYEKLDYSIILDTYTIDLPEFEEKYNKGDNQTKVGLNIQKIIEAINTKDYEYVYNKLDETFKNNTFGNIETFKEYIHDNFFEYNKVESGEYSTEGDLNIYKIKIKDVNDDTTEEADFTIIMQLLDNSDFIMSFSNQ